MLGATRGVTPSLVGWLWADILLGLFVIFLAASSAPAQAIIPTPTPSATQAPGIAPEALLFTVPVDGPTLLAGTPSAIAAEQKRIATELSGHVQGAAPSRRVAIVLAYGSHEDPVEGDRLVHVAVAALNSGPFAGATIKTFHHLVPGDRGTVIAVEVYLYQ